jgi:hypothetical protein
MQIQTCYGPLPARATAASVDIGIAPELRLKVLGVEVRLKAYATEKIGEYLGGVRL